MSIFLVTLTHRKPRQRAVKVVADYFNIKDGALAFRMERTGGQYPRCVRLFAAGEWRDVEEAAQ